MTPAQVTAARDRESWKKLWEREHARYEQMASQRDTWRRRAQAAEAQLAQGDTLKTGTE